MQAFDLSPTLAAHLLTPAPVMPADTDALAAAAEPSIHETGRRFVVAVDWLPVPHHVDAIGRAAWR